ncbi:PDGLE domain-containing protein [Actinomycetota bacterium]
MNRNVVLAVVAVIVIAITGLMLSQFASSDPDGLEFVAEEEGFSDTAEDHTLGDAPLADYGENLDQDPAVSTAVAAIIGLAATAVLTVGLFWLARSRSDEHAAAPPG